MVQESSFQLIFHHTGSGYPHDFRARVRALLLCARREGSPLSKLPAELLGRIIEALACSSYCYDGRRR